MKEDEALTTETYFQDVIDPGDRASAIAKDLCFKTHESCPAVTIVPHQPGNFRGAVGFRWQRHILQSMLDEQITEEIENDGAGGKPQFFTLVGTPQVFLGLGWEIIEMVVEDFTRSGRFPAIIDNAVDVKKVVDVNFPLIRAMFEGYANILQLLGLVNITGEVAIMKHQITAFCDDDSDEQLVLTWGASCIGLSHPDRYIDGSAILPGMPIVGFWEPGYRCNGGTFFTNLLLAKFGPEVAGIRQSVQAMDLVKKLTVPSQNYSRTVTRLVGWNRDGSLTEPLAKIAGIAHITGGGVWGKFAELLPDGVGAKLNKMPKPAPVLLQAQEWSWDTPYKLPDLNAYGTLHGGCGMLVVCNTNADAVRVIAEAKSDGILAQVVGHTTESKEDEVTIESRFKEGRPLSSNELVKA